MTTRADDCWQEANIFSITVENDHIRLSANAKVINESQLMVLLHDSLFVKWKYMDILSTFAKMQVKAEFLFTVRLL